MANAIRVIPKIRGNIIGIFLNMPATGQSRQVATIETPNDYQTSDDVVLAEEICKAYRKRINKSITT